MIQSEAADKILFILVGAVLGWLLQQYRVARGEDVALVNEHIKDIEKFRDVAQDYWLKLPKDVLEEEAAAARVRAAHAALTLVYEQISHIAWQKSEQYKFLSIEMFKAATGGAFESARDGIDAQRAIQAYDRAAEVIHLLRVVRRDVISLKRLLPRLLIDSCNFDKVTGVI